MIKKIVLTMLTVCFMCTAFAVAQSSAGVAKTPLTDDIKEVLKKYPYAEMDVNSAKHQVQYSTNSKAVKSAQAQMVIKLEDLRLSVERMIKTAYYDDFLNAYTDVIKNYNSFIDDSNFEFVYADNIVAGNYVKRTLEKTIAMVDDIYTVLEVHVAANNKNNAAYINILHRYAMKAENILSNYSITISAEPKLYSYNTECINILRKIKATADRLEADKLLISFNSLLGKLINGTESTDLQLYSISYRVSLTNMVNAIAAAQEEFGNEIDALQNENMQ
ncbi:hypothetical protein AAIR98_001291 [Elusimicrobium simillimum]|uniref:hypothetical protein n=1 Tax=Elusimicrobium simillimum TaxID=3143438 RepID=UPI003C6F003B